MTDDKLADEIDRWRKHSSKTNYPLPILVEDEWQQIIAALRRGALEEWSQQVRLTVRGIDAQAERITKREQTTWRDGENQAPDEDRDFEDVVIGYKLNTGLWHRLLGLLASCPANERPPSGEMVMVPRKLIDRAVLWLHTLAENGMDATFFDGERTPNAVAMDDIAAQFSALSAAEAEGRK